MLRAQVADKNRLPGSQPHELPCVLLPLAAADSELTLPLASNVVPGEPNDLGLLAPSATRPTQTTAKQNDLPKAPHGRAPTSPWRSDTYLQHETRRSQFA